MALHISSAERSHPTFEVRGRSREGPMPEGQRPRGVTPCPRSGAAAESTRLRRHRNSREELPRVRGQGERPRGDTPRPRSGVATRGVTPHPRSGVAAGRSYPTPPRPKARGSGREEQPHLQGAVGVRVQEGLEELFRIQGQKGWR